MFHKHTNQLPLYILNHTSPSDLPPRYSQTEQSTLRLDSRFVCLTFIFALCVLALIFLLVLDQVFILTHLENISESCSTTNLDNWEVHTKKIRQLFGFTSIVFRKSVEVAFQFQFSWRTTLWWPPGNLENPRFLTNWKFYVNPLLRKRRNLFLVSCLPNHSVDGNIHSRCVISTELPKKVIDYPVVSMSNSSISYSCKSSNSKHPIAYPT